MMLLENSPQSMDGKKIYITEYDKMRLEELIEVADAFADHDRRDLRDLQAELKRARVVPSMEVPADVVTMNSRLVLRDLDTSEQMTYTLVFPKNEDFDTGKISILAPIGTAILGCSVGDMIEWPVPSGERRLLIVEILYQPEAAGDYHL